MRKLKNLLKEPIYKEDLKRVLLNGFLAMFFFSLLAGALQFVANIYLNLSFGILVYLFAFMIGKKTSESFFNYHILYSIISILFFILGYILYEITYYVFVFHNVGVVLQAIFSPNFFDFCMTFLNPKAYGGLNTLYRILDILIFGVSLFTAYQIPNRRK